MDICATALQVWLHYKHNRFYGYNTITKTCYHAEHMHAVSWEDEREGIGDCSSLDTQPQIRFCILPRSSFGTSDTSSLILLKIISKTTVRTGSAHREALNYEEKRKRGKSQVVPPPPLLLGFSRLHAPLLSQCPDNVSACV